MQIARIVSCTALVFAMTWTVDTSVGQDPVCSGVPSECGQWAGPIDLGDYINVPIVPPPPPPLPTILEQGEIGHAALILGGPESGRILFWCWPNTGDDYRPLTYLWTPTSDPSAPVDFDVISPDPLWAWSLSNDIFCAGHAFTKDGDLLVAGGEDICTKLHPTVCPPPPLSEPPYGANTAFIFRIATGQWEPAGSMYRERWYPTAVEVPNGNVVLLGHAGDNPDLDPLSQQSRDSFEFATGAFLPLRKNHRNSGMGCDSPPYFNIQDYPRVHVTASNELMWMDGNNGLPDAHTAWFLGLPPNVEDCLPSYEEPYRWRPGVPTLDSMYVGFQHRGGNSIHYLIYTGASTVNEVIYAIGGIDGADDTTNCPEPIHGRIARLTNPTASATWDESPPDLWWPRYNHNSLILFDGSFIVVGGTGHGQFGGCKAIRTPEIVYPIEVFGAPTSQPAAIHSQPREYHSTALVLVNGQVASIGGSEDPDTEGLNKHNVEVYSPPYLFKGLRPVLLNPPTAPVHYGDTYPLDVQMRASNNVDRVVLLRNGSVTHAFDQNQRYIQLYVPTQPLPPMGTPPKTTVTFRWPHASPVAPPGYYMLAVVDDNGVPSVASVIKLE